MPTLVIETKDLLTYLEENELKRDLDKLDHNKYQIILRFIRPEYRNNKGVWNSRKDGMYDL